LDVNEERDPFEDRLAVELLELADTAVPGSRSDAEVATLSMATARRSRLALAFGTAAAVVAGIAAAAVLVASRHPGLSGEQASPPAESTQLVYACGIFAFPPTLTDESPIDLKSTAAGTALAQFIDSGQGGEPLLPREGWHVAGMDDSTASFVAPIPGDPPYAEAQAERTKDGWRIVGWGQCRPSLRLQGVKAATWTIVPGQEINAATQTFMVDVTELACASGKSMGDRLRAPIIAYEPDRVIVTLTVEPLPEDQDCPGNPPTRIRLELAEPLGDRKLFDGGTLPWHDPAIPAYPSVDQLDAEG
jgi:hypothetical protein